LILLLGFFELVTAIELFREASWAKDMSAGLFGDQLVIWAVIDLVVGLVALFTGYSIFKGASFGRWAGVIIASISAIRWFWMVAFNPWMAAIIIILDILIIYGLLQHWDWFEQVPGLSTGAISLTTDDGVFSH
jgi:hypothetical protein